VTLKEKIELGFQDALLKKGKDKGLLRKKYPIDSEFGGPVWFALATCDQINNWNCIDAAEYFSSSFYTHSYTIEQKDVYSWLSQRSKSFDFSLFVTRPATADTDNLSIEHEITLSGLFIIDQVDEESRELSRALDVSSEDQIKLFKAILGKRC